MSLPLPPRKLIRTDAATAKLVHDQFTSVVAGHVQATTTYRFYEELDDWLGPWGQSGYPIAYGKFYNLAFTGNQKLMSNPQTKDWVWKTTILLQEALRDFVVACVKNGSIVSLTEAQLRKAAFDSHPKAYAEGGLALVTMTAPELVPVIATIPAKEFSPTSENFGPTVKQVFVTLGYILPQMTGTALATLAGPAHTGLFSRAVQMDQRRFMDQMNLSRELTGIRTAVELGYLDHVPLLDALIAQLNARQFPDQGFAQAAREIVMAALQRRTRVLAGYQELLKQSPEVRGRIDKAFPNLLPPAGK
jgi:hypothetical protein